MSKEIENEKTSEAVTESVSDNSQKKSKLAFMRSGWFIALASVLAFAVILAIMIGVAVGVRGVSVRELFGMEPKRLDYMKDNLNVYIDIEDEDYKNYDLEVNITKPTEELDLQHELMRLLKTKKMGSILNNGSYQLAGQLGIGDKAYVYYCGYEYDDDGNRIEVPGTSNISNVSPSELVIGSGSFVKGFELGLIGKSPMQVKYETFNYGGVGENDVVYATVSYIDAAGVVHDSEDVRIDLGDAKLEEKWGEGIYEDVLKKVQIGLIYDEVEHLYLANSDGMISYTEIVVNYVTRFDEAANKITVEALFPHNYSEVSLRNKTVYFDVFLVKFLDYESPDFSDIDDAFITETLEISEETLAEYEGNNTVEKFKSYKMAELIAEYEKNFDTCAENALWERLNEAIRVKKYPTAEIERIYNDYVYSYKLSYASSGDETESEGWDEYMRYALNMGQDGDWTEVLLERVKSEVKEKLIFYSILRRENLLGDEQTKARIYREELEADFEHYTGKSSNDYESAAAFESALYEYEALILEEYGMSSYLDSVYYNYASKKILAYANIVNPNEK